MPQADRTASTGLKQFNTGGYYDAKMGKAEGMSLEEIRLNKQLL